MKNSHKYQAFALTCLIFAPLLLFAIAYEPQKLDLKADDSLNLVIGQFVTKEIQTLQKPAPKPQPEFKKEHKKKMKDMAKKDRKKDVKKPEPRKEVAAVSNSAPVISTLMVGKDNNEFLKAVKLAVDKAAIDTYPRQALQMNLEGSALVEFTWLGGAKLGSVKIAKSSGHRILDDNAIRVIKRASKNFPSYSNDVSVTIPIKYGIKRS